jgi:AbrB family looped-hinge helix DNA binding protein
MTDVITKVGKKYMVVIPSKIRRALGVKEGDLLKMKLEGSRIILEKLPSDPFKVLAEVVGESYDEREDEARTERWLLHGGSRH